MQPGRNSTQENCTWFAFKHSPNQTDKNFIILPFLNWATQTPLSGGCKDDDSADSSLEKHPILRVCIHSVSVPYASPSPHAASHLSYLEEWLWTKKKKKICLYQVKSIFFQFQMEVSSLIGVMEHNQWHYNSIKGKEIISVSPSLHHRASSLFLLADLCNKAVSLEELNILRR